MIIGKNYVHGGDIYTNDVWLDFSANVNPFGTPEAVKAAVREAAEHMDIYPDPYCGRLRAALAEKTGVDENCIICGNGAAELIYQFVNALRPKRTLLPVPSFADYEAALLSAGCEPVLYPLKREREFAICDDILDSISGCDAVMLCNPNNPTGKMIDKALLMSIADKCRSCGTWLFLDECFMELCDRGYSLAGEIKNDDKIFILHAFTKTYGMAGVRLGYGICAMEELLHRMSRISQPWNVSNTAQAAGLAALSCDTWAADARKLFREEKEYLMRELARLGIDVHYGEANFLFITGAYGLYEKLLRRGILIRSCANYHGLDKGDCRIAVRTHDENAALIKAVSEVWDA